MRPSIRLAIADDAAQALAIYDPVVRETTISFEVDPPTLAEMRLRITTTLERYPWLVCAAEDELLGYAYAGPHRSRPAYQWAVDVSVYIGPRRRRQGVGAALYTTLLRTLARQGFYSAYAGIALPNPGSVALHEALGFVAVGVYHQVGYKLGRWHDVGWWQRSLQPRRDEPAPPLSIAALEHDAEWAAALAAGLARLRLQPPPAAEERDSVAPG